LIDNKISCIFKPELTDKDFQKKQGANDAEK